MTTQPRRALTLTLACAACALACLTARAAQSQQKGGKPAQQQARADGPEAATAISLSGLLKALEIGGLAEKELVQLVEKRGVAFELNPEDELSLRRAGATNPIVEAVGKNYRGPVSLQEFRAMLNLSALRPPRFTHAEMLDNVKKRGAGFRLTAADEARLVEEGATREVLEAARANYRRPPGSGNGVGSGGGGGFGPGRGENRGGGGPGGGGGTGEVDYTRPFRGDEVTQRAAILSKPEPRYTDEARRHSISGFVRLRVLLNSSGTVTNISVVKGLPHGLTEEAIEAAKRIRFRPAQKDGREVSQWVLIDYNFYTY